METVLVLVACGLVARKYSFEKAGRLTLTPAVIPEPAVTPEPTAAVTPAQSHEVVLGSGIIAQDDDDAFLQEQFFPQDTRNTGGHSVTQKPWMRAGDQYNIPKSEIEKAFPTIDDRDDIHGISSIPQRMREIESKTRTVPRWKEKQFESPIEPEMTATGEGRGFHPMKRYHKFLLSENPLLELPEGPRGNFVTGAGKSALKSDLRNDKSELTVEHTGIPAVVASFKVGNLESTREFAPSNAEGYNMEKFTGASSRAPVVKSLVQPSFSVAHDESIDTYCANLYTGRGKKPSTLDKHDATMTSKDASIPTPSVTGAAGGTRLGAINVSSKISPKTKHDGIAESSSRILSKVGSKSSAPGTARVMPSYHEVKDETLAEITPTPKRSAASYMTKAIDTNQVKEFKDNKEHIDEKNRTTEFFLAPKNTSLPINLGTKPTASVVPRNFTFKTDKLVGVSDVALNRGKSIDRRKLKQPLVSESIEKKRIGGMSFLADRLPTGNSAALLANPYLKTRAK